MRFTSTPSLPLTNAKVTVEFTELMTPIRVMTMRTASLLIKSIVIASLLVLAACHRGTKLQAQQETLTFEGWQISWQDFVNSGGRCATPGVSRAEGVRKEKRLKEFKIDKKKLERKKLIEVYIHVINKGDHSITDGNITKQRIYVQMNILNKNFEGTNFQFHLVDINRETNPDWYVMHHDTPIERAAMQKLGVMKKKKDVLNIYTAALPGTNGWAVYPWEYSANPYRDGVVIRFSTMPGGDTPYGEGMTLVHEVGHWLGLLHTYENGCTPPGDRVDDTPAEAKASYSCASRNTCHEDSEWDPIENFMDYSPDSCVTRFTAGQSTRMDAKFDECRLQEQPCSP